LIVIVSQNTKQWLGLIFPSTTSELDFLIKKFLIDDRDLLDNPSVHLKSLFFSAIVPCEETPKRLRILVRAWSTQSLVIALESDKRLNKTYPTNY
jgi:hypothetical protein